LNPRARRKNNITPPAFACSATQPDIAGHGLVRQILSEYLSVPPATIEFELGHAGKPRLSAAQHATDLSFNYSRAENELLLAFSATHEVGVDIERRRGAVELFDIAAQHFSPIERQILRSCATPEETFFRCWTAKEAMVKAMGMGISQPLNEFTTLVDERTLLSKARVVHSAELVCDLALRSVQVDAGYCAALAVVVDDCHADFAVIPK
jgi:4'-phosphopantetheinyl transferase